MENYRKFVGLRYALIPYIYTCSRVAHDTGLPLVRGTYLEYPDQEPAYTFQQQYLFGKDLLVAPITAPGEGKPVRKEVFLPAGQDWFDFFTGDFYAGGQTIVHECPLDRMPLFVRAGSILPMAPAMDYSDQKPVDPLTLDVYAGPRAAEFNLYEDDGDVAGLPGGGVCLDAAALQLRRGQGTTRCASARPRGSSRDSWPNAATRCRSTACASRTALR